MPHFFRMLVLGFLVAAVHQTKLQWFRPNEFLNVCSCRALNFVAQCLKKELGLTLLWEFVH